METAAFIKHVLIAIPKNPPQVKGQRQSRELCYFSRKEEKKTALDIQEQPYSLPAPQPGKWAPAGHWSGHVPSADRRGKEY